MLAGKLRGGIRSQVSQLFSGSSLNTTVYQSAGSYTYVQTGLWNAGNSLIAAARAVAGLPDAYRYNYDYFPQWNYIIDNVKIVFLGYEAALDLQVNTSVSAESSILLK